MDTRQVSISKLKSHPYQESVYLNEPGSKIQKLAMDIKENGQRAPIQITPDNVIIDGHCRVEAIQKLGDATIWATVVEVQDEGEMRRRHLDANINRRHLEKIDLVRIVKARLELEYEGRYCHEDKLRERIAEAFGQDKRETTVRRYLRLVKLPDLIQEKFKRKELKLVTAIKFDSLDQNEQNELLNLIDQEEMSPEETFAQFFDVPKVSNIGTAPAALVCDAVKDGSDLDPDKLTPTDALRRLAGNILDDVKLLEVEVIEEIPSTAQVDGLVKASLNESKTGLENVIRKLGEKQNEYKAYRNWSSQ